MVCLIHCTICHNTCCPGWLNIHCPCSCPRAMVAGSSCGNRLCPAKGNSNNLSISIAITIDSNHCSYRTNGREYLCNMRQYQNNICILLPFRINSSYSSCPINLGINGKSYGKCPILCGITCLNKSYITKFKRYLTLVISITINSNHSAYCTLYWCQICQVVKYCEINIPYRI